MVPIYTNCEGVVVDDEDGDDGVSGYDEDGAPHVEDELVSDNGKDYPLGGDDKLCTLPELEKIFLEPSLPRSKGLV
jgi:hypothetical protein